MPNPTPEDLLGLTEAEGKAGGLDAFLNAHPRGQGWGMLMMLQNLMNDPGYAPFAMGALRTSRQNTPEGQYYNQHLYGMLDLLNHLRGNPFPRSQGGQGQ